MFKKVFETIRRTFAGTGQPKPGGRINTRRTPSDRSRSLLEKIGAPPPAPTARAGHPRSPEELCGISPAMSTDEIKAHLALLYRRYNHAASSLDAKTRADAEAMLDAVVAVREKTFGPI